MSYDLFISYARRDNANGAVSALKSRIETAYRAFSGRDLRVFFDTEAIRGMDDWRHRIQRSLRDSQLFLAVLSPQYLASPYCRWEWEDYVRFEAMRQCLGEGVAPVFFVSLPGTTDSGVDPYTARWIAQIQERQTFDLRAWADEGENTLREAHVKAMLDQLQDSLHERLGRSLRGRESPSNLLRHNPFFVGRVRELTALRNALTRNVVGVVGAQPGSTVAVQGLGGMGKTELALAYAHAFAWDYPGGRWQVPCEFTSDLRLALTRLASPMGFAFTEDEKKDLEKQFERVLRELQRRGRCLLLLDNVDHAELLAPAVLDRLPRDGRLDLIVTTRLAQSQIGGSAQANVFVSVDELPEDDAVALLRAHQPDGRFASEQEDAAAGQIARLLEGFTLAVETAAIYLGRHPASDACGRFRERLATDLLHESDAAAADATVLVRHRERLLATTLSFTLATLSEDARELLRRASLLPADQVAVPWLRALSGHPTADEGTDGTGPDHFTESLELLAGLRLLQRGDAVDADERPLIVRMHRLVQDLIRREIPAADRESREEAIVALVQRRDAVLERTTDWMEARWELGPLAAVGSSWADRGHPRASWLLSQVCLKLSENAEWIRAEPLIRRAITIAEAALGSDHPTVATRLTNLGQVLKATNRYSESEAVMRRALASAERTGVDDPPTLALRLNNLGQLLHECNRLPEAEPLLRRALTIDEGARGPSHRDVARDCSNLGMLLFDLGRLPESEALLRRAVTISIEGSRGLDSDTARYAGNLARILTHTNRLAQAEPILRRSLAIYEGCLGTDHPRVATVLNSLAAILSKTNRSEEAEGMLRRALVIDERRFGPNHPEVATDLNNLGELLQGSNRAEEAEQLLTRALSIYEENGFAEHTATAACLNNLALLRHEANRHDEAARLMQRALQIDIASRGLEHPLVALRMNNLGAMLQTTGHVAEAEACYLQALASHERSLGPDHPDVALDLNNLGCVLRDTGRLAEADRLLQRSLQILLRFRSATGHEHLRQRTTLANYAQLLYMTGRSGREVVDQLNAVSLPFGYPVASHDPSKERPADKQ